MKIGIIIEVLKRELPFLSILKKRLELEGHEVKLITFRSMCFHQIRKFRPDILVTNGIRSDRYMFEEIAYTKKYFRTKIMCYYSEQIGYSDRSVAFTYDNKNVLNNVDFHICWGEQFAKELGDLGVERNKIWVIGSMQYDIPSYFKFTVDELKNRLANEYKISNAKAPYFLITDNIIKEYQPVDLYPIRRKAFIDLTIQLAQRHPEANIIFRTHPEISESEQKLLNDSFSAYSNIYCINQGHLFYWSHICQSLLYWCSTSSVQALLDGKNVFALRTDETLDRYWFLNVFPLFESISELLDAVDSDYAGTYALQDNNKLAIEHFIKTWYYRVDGLSFERFVQLINIVSQSDFVPYEGPEMTYSRVFKSLYYENRAKIGDLIKCRKGRSLSDSMIEKELSNYNVERKDAVFNVRFDGIANYLENE